MESGVAQTEAGPKHAIWLLRSVRIRRQDKPLLSYRLTRYQMLTDSVKAEPYPSFPFI